MEDIQQKRIDLVVKLLKHKSDSIESLCCNLNELHELLPPIC